MGANFTRLPPNTLPRPPGVLPRRGELGQPDTEDGDYDSEAEAEARRKARERGAASDESSGADRSGAGSSNTPDDRVESDWVGKALFSPSMLGTGSAGQAAPVRGESSEADSDARVA